ncbi:MAG: PEP-CTERM sorting domain-containing protein [Candidatus Berkelbacteria bacterium]|nr:PEP-CTERM sorting domain-containing protein [Candidatus Berkelbacteria bacterium]
MYGLDFDDSFPYQPSKWTAYGGSPQPDIMPSWTRLGGLLSNPNDPHRVKVELIGGFTKFWIDDILLDTTSFSMPNAKLRLGAFAWTNGDTVDATYSSIVVSPVPEPATIAILGIGLALIAKRRRK